MTAPATSRADRYAAKLAGTCISGHKLTDANTYWRPTQQGEPRRQCKQCRRDRQRVADRKKRAEARKSTTGVQYLSVRPRRARIKDASWHARAACLASGPDAFTPYDSETTDVPERAQAAAYRYCARCPVRDLCDQQATRNREYGLWGGKWRDIDRYTKKYRVRDLLLEVTA